MNYKIIKNDKGEIGYFLISDNAFIDDNTIKAEIISKGYCFFNTVGQINCFVDSSMEYERKDDSRLIEMVDETN